MCGIVGYVGEQSALEVVVEGLRRLEYRGYDSAGVALISDGKLVTEKRAGKLANLDAALAENPLGPATTGIGHTRWATHGAPNDRNAHPHVDCTGSVAVIHNGIIENFAQLRAELSERGHELASDTDTEAVAHLLEEECRVDAGEAIDLPPRCGPSASGSRAPSPSSRPTSTPRTSSSARGATRRWSSAAARARTSWPPTSPRSSRTPGRPSSSARTRSSSSAGTASPSPTSTGTRATSRSTTSTGTSPPPRRAATSSSCSRRSTSSRRPWPTPCSAASTTTTGSSWTRCGITDDDLREIDKIIVIACGTSFHAGLVAKYAIEHWTRIPCEVELASEFRYRDPVLTRSTLIVAISQSGETMDTLMALRHAREQKAKVLSICNTNGSTMPRESDAVLYTHAGPEVAVASTKGYLTQIVACYLVGLYLAQVRGTKYGDEIAKVVDDLRAMPAKMATVLADLEPVRELARELAGATSVLFLGRHVGYPTALEGALKLKELAYMHAEGFAAGELKHGPIALIEDGVPVITAVPSPRGRSVLHDKVVSNLQEVRARGARTIVIAEEGDTDVEPYADVIIRIPESATLLQPLLSTIPLQVFACEMAKVRGHDVDQPRNLAKSVTVE